MNQSALLRVFLPNDAIVMVADIADEYPTIPMHLNYAVATPVEIMALHNMLYTRFIGSRRQIVDIVGRGEFKFPPEAETEELRQVYAERAIKLARAIGRHNRQNSFWGRNFGSDASYEAEIVGHLMKEVNRRIAEAKRRT
jgi:hypothetical protein